MTEESEQTCEYRDDQLPTIEGWIQCKDTTNLDNWDAHKTFDREWMNCLRNSPQPCYFPEIVQFYDEMKEGLDTPVITLRMNDLWVEDAVADTVDDFKESCGLRGGHYEETADFPGEWCFCTIPGYIDYPCIGSACHTETGEEGAMVAWPNTCSDCRCDSDLVMTAERAEERYNKALEYMNEVWDGVLHFEGLYQRQTITRADMPATCQTMYEESGFNEFMETEFKECRDWIFDLFGAVYDQDSPEFAKYLEVFLVSPFNRADGYAKKHYDETDDTQIPHIWIDEWFGFWESESLGLSILAHEVGHVKGLHHTFNQINYDDMKGEKGSCTKCDPSANSWNNGDFIYDTLGAPDWSFNTSDRSLYASNCTISFDSSELCLELPTVYEDDVTSNIMSYNFQCMSIEYGLSPFQKAKTRCNYDTWHIGHNMRDITTPSVVYSEFTQNEDSFEVKWWKPISEYTCKGSGCTTEYRLMMGENYETIAANDDQMTYTVSSIVKDVEYYLVAVNADGQMSQPGRKFSVASAADDTSSFNDDSGFSDDWSDDFSDGETRIVCPGNDAQDFCDCEDDCFANNNFCSCVEAQACCAGAVVNPTSMDYSDDYSSNDDSGFSDDWSDDGSDDCQPITCPSSCDNDEELVYYYDGHCIEMCRCEDPNDSSNGDCPQVSCPPSCGENESMASYFDNNGCMVHCTCEPLDGDMSSYSDDDMWWSDDMSSYSADYTPEAGTVLCPGKQSGEYCDCESDCGANNGFCDCVEAQACCGGAVVNPTSDYSDDFSMYSDYSGDMIACPEDAMECSDGSVVVRDPENDCQFPACQASGGSADSCSNMACADVQGASDITAECAATVSSDCEAGHFTNCGACGDFSIPINDECFNAISPQFDAICGGDSEDSGSSMDMEESCDAQTACTVADTFCNTDAEGAFCESCDGLDTEAKCNNDFDGEGAQSCIAACVSTVDPTDPTDPPTACDAQTPCTVADTFCNMDAEGAFCESCDGLDTEAKCNNDLDGEGAQSCIAACVSTVDPTDPTDPPTDPPVVVESTVTSVMKFSGLTTDNFDAAKPGIKNSLSASTNVPTDKIALTLNSRRARRSLDEASVTCVFTTSDAAAVTTAIQDDSFAADVTAHMAASDDAAVSSLGVTQVSEPVTATTTTTTTSTAPNSDPDSSTLAISVISALVAGLALF